MPGNNELTVYLDDQQADQVLMYQEKKGLTKSKAGGELLDVGLDYHFGGLDRYFFWELTKMGVWVGLTLSLLWWWGGVGLLPVDAYLAPLTYFFLSLALISLLVHLSDANPFGWIVGLVGRSGDERGA